MARSPKPRIINTQFKRVKTTSPFPFLPSRGGIGLAELERRWRVPASRIRQWVADGLLERLSNGLYSNSAIVDFQREHPDLLEPTPYQSPGAREPIPDPAPEDPEA